MKFHGRVAPGRLDDLTKPLQIVLHAPRKLAGVTIKVWEMDTFAKGKTGSTSEGSADDLLATFHGEISADVGVGATRKPEWRKFTVTEAKIEEAKRDVARFSLRFAGDTRAYEIPILSELGEVEGGAYEIGFSMEVGGSEKFRTKSPCLFSPKVTPLRLIGRMIENIDRRGVVKKTMYDRPLAYRCVAIGKRTTTDDHAKLEILARGCTDGAGYLFDRALDEPGDEPPRPLIVRADRELFLIDAAVPFEKAGPTEIPIAACDQVVVKGHDVIVVRSGITDPMSLGIAERPGTDDDRFGTDTVDAPDLSAALASLTVRSRTARRRGIP